VIPYLTERLLSFDADVALEDFCFVLTSFSNIIIDLNTNGLFFCGYVSPPIPSLLDKSFYKNAAYQKISAQRRLIPTFQIALALVVPVIRAFH
jgi:glucokinase